ncbi:MAG: hypothetical protein M0P69_16120 [Bacteroidales bacterium]|nr:hypothetical protein [Bacteroidales bacterium]
MALDFRFRWIKTKLLQIGAVKLDEISTDGTMAGNSDTAIPTEKAVKAYVDASKIGLNFKTPVDIATVAAGVLATSFAAGEIVDGAELVVGDRILVKNQADGKENGIYVVTAGAPTRATDADAATDILGMIVPVLEGTVNADSCWVCTNDTPIVVGTTVLAFAIFGGLKAGNGITITADVMSVDTAVVMDLSTAQTATNKTLTAPKINEDVALTATATELNQLDSVTVGGTAAGDIATIDAAQILTSKTFASLVLETSREEAFEILFAEATTGTLAGATDDIPVAVPEGAWILGVSMNNDLATVDTTGDDTYTAAWSGGLASDINGGAPIAAAKNTKVTQMGPMGITGGVTNITLTPNAGEFSAGDVRAVVVYAIMKDLASQ